MKITHIDVGDGTVSITQNAGEVTIELLNSKGDKCKEINTTFQGLSVLVVNLNRIEEENPNQLPLPFEGEMSVVPEMKMADLVDASPTEYDHYGEPQMKLPPLADDNTVYNYPLTPSESFEGVYPTEHDIENFRHKLQKLHNENWKVSSLMKSVNGEFEELPETVKNLIIGEIKKKYGTK